MTSSQEIPTAGSPRRASPFALLSRLAPLTALAVVVAVFAALERPPPGKPAGFLTVDNARTIAVSSVVVATAALGMTLIVIAGGIDLSAGTAVALSAVALAWCLNQGHGAGTAIAAALGVGAVTGFCNGLLISRLRVVPFIITLGTMSIYLGVAKRIAKETTLRPPLASIPQWLQDLVSVSEVDWTLYPVLPNFPSGIWLFLALAAALAFVLKQTTFGRYLFAIGSNEATARLCGIDVPRTKLAVYVLAGLFIGTAGVLQFSRLSIGNPTSGNGLELKIIAAVVVGGGSLSGGRGSVLGTIAGALLMEVIDAGCSMLGLEESVQNMALGAIIIAAVAFDELRRRKMNA